MAIAKSSRHGREDVGRAASHAALLVFVVVALLVGMCKAPWRGESATHDARQFLAAAAEAAHLHDSDTGAGTDNVSGHTHGHDASDHQHDVMHLPPVLLGMGCHLDDGWQTVHAPQRLPGSPWQIERPPRKPSRLA